jgi:hypothetical protein
VTPSASTRVELDQTLIAAANAAAAGAAAASAVQHEREHRALPGSPAGVVDKLGRHFGIIHNRVTPFVEPDPLREQLGAHAVGDTIDRVDPEAHG